MRSILTVTSAANSYDLITLAALKLELGITNSDSDELLSQLISQASGVVADITGRVWIAETVEEKFYFNYWECVPTLVLRRRPVISITTLTENGAALVEDVDFAVDAEKGMLYRIKYGAFLNGVIGSPSVVVDYIGGYVLSGSPSMNIPRGLERATMILSKAYWFSNTRDPNVRSETTFELDSITYRDAADAEKAVADLLSLYSDPAVA